MTPAAALSSRRQGLLIGLVAALAIVAFNVAWVAAVMGGPLHRPRRVLESDHLHYIEMARGYEQALARASGEPGGGGVRPELALRAPYCWRVAVPGAAALLMRAGLSVHAAYFLLTNLALVAFLCVLWGSLADLGFDPRLRLIGLALVGLTQGAVRWHEYQYWMTDPAGLLVVAAGVRLARRLERGAAADLAPLGALLFAGAFVRETWVLVPPVAFFALRRGHGTVNALGLTAALSLPPLAASVALRLMIEPRVHPGWWDSIADNLGFRLNHAGDNQLYVLTLGTWGVLLPLALLVPGRLRDHARRHAGDLSLLAFVYVTTVLISNNNDRPLAYALPALLPAALCGLRRLVAASGASGTALTALVLSLQALVYVQTRFTGLGISVYQPVSWPAVTALVAFWVAAVFALRRVDRRAAKGDP